MGVRLSDPDKLDAIIDKVWQAQGFDCYPDGSMPLDADEMRALIHEIVIAFVVERSDEQPASSTVGRPE